MKVYWANALFTAADREFNARCVERLRDEGFDVIAPQEIAANALTSPSAEEIFRADTRAILSADLIVACLDLEGIDSGVACEVGIAWEAGIPVIGLYTDIRQDRLGAGRMYKNLYVLGCIGAPTARSLEEVRDLLHAHQGRQIPISSRDIASHYDSVAPRYCEVVERLATQQVPAWNPVGPLFELLSAAPCLRVLEVGCGAGSLVSLLRTHVPDLHYVGYDLSTAMIRKAQASQGEHDAVFTNDWEVVASVAATCPFDLVVAQFVLHDLGDRPAVLSQWSRVVRPGGRLVITDLTSDDLPGFTTALRTGLLLPRGRGRDPRLRVPDLLAEAHAAGLTVEAWRLDTPTVTFDGRADLEEYLEVFGIYAGMDLPLNLDPLTPDANAAAVGAILEALHWPLTDRRVFLSCIMEHGTFRDDSSPSRASTVPASRR